MKRRHFDSLRPVCPACLHQGQTAAPLRLASVAHEENEIIYQGILHCSNALCQREYPILDGLPILVPDLRTYISENLLPVLARDDLAADLETLFGDCCGPGSAYDVHRQYLSSYTWDHYGDLDPEENSSPRPGGVARVLGELLVHLPGKAAPQMLPSPRYSGERGRGEGSTGGQIPSPSPPLPGVPGREEKRPILDAGCSVGRSAFDLAEDCQSPVLGVDLNFSMLRVAARALHQGIVRYPRKRVGLAYDRREFAVDFPGRDLVDFWVCDLLAPPFAPDTFGSVVALNVLDCVASPVQFLERGVALLETGGTLVLTTPYDWSAAVPVDAWIGGHSQRGPHQGSSELILRGLLTPGAYPQSLPKMQIIADLERLPWHVRLHERSVMEYQVHGIVARKVE